MAEDDADILPPESASSAATYWDRLLRHHWQALEKEEGGPHRVGKASPLPGSLLLREAAPGDNMSLMRCCRRSAFKDASSSSMQPLLAVLHATCSFVQRPAPRAMARRGKRASRMGLAGRPCPRGAPTSCQAAGCSACPAGAASSSASASAASGAWTTLTRTTSTAWTSPSRARRSAALARSFPCNLRLSLLKMLVHAWELAHLTGSLARALPCCSEDPKHSRCTAPAQGCLQEEVS